MNDQRVLVVVSGFSGAGKGTLIEALFERYHNYALSTSATTRRPRVEEVDGREYFFVTRECFGEMAAKEELIEYAQYVDNYYGTPRQYALQQMADGKDVISEIEIQGALKIKEKLPKALLLFVLPLSANVPKERLTERGTESMEVTQAKFHRASEEAAGTNFYDYILVNDKVDACVEEMYQLIQAQHSRVSSNLDFIEQMKQELKKY